MPPDAVQVARGATYLMIQKVVTSAAMVASFAILSRLITVKEMGIMAALLLVTELCQVVATLALQQAATRFIAKEFALGMKRIAGSIFYQAIRTTLLLAAPLAALVFAGANVLSVQLLGEDGYAVLFRVLAFDVLLYAGMLPVLWGALLGLQKFRETAILSVMNTLVRQSLIVLLIIFLRNFVGLVVAWVLADFVATSLYLAYISNILGRPKFDYALRNLLSFSWPLSISNAVGFAYSWFDRALLLALVPLATLGVYNAAIIAFNVLIGTAGAIATALFSAYSAMQSIHQRHSLSNAIYVASRHVSFIAVPLAFGLLATAKPALTVFVGPAYEEGTGPLMVLAGIYGITLFGTVLSPMLLAVGRTRWMSTITIVSLIVSLIVAYLLLPALGMLGAAIARALAMVLETVLTIVVLRRTMSFRIDVKSVSKSLVAGLVMAVVIISTQSLAYDKILLPLYVLIGAIVYAFMLRLLKAMGQEDLELIRGYLGKELGWVADFIGRVML